MNVFDGGSYDRYIFQRSYYTWLEKDGDYGGLKEPPKVGDFCCARFSQDMRWYRARVLSLTHGE